MQAKKPPTTPTDTDNHRQKPVFSAQSVVSYSSMVSAVLFRGVSGFLFRALDVFKAMGYYHIAF
jgi:hypothetical protein